MADLIIASKNGYKDKVNELLETGSSVTVRDRDNATALYWSACRGYPQICVALVHAGSDINARVTWGSTPLHAAADRGHIDCVETLITLGADLDIQNIRGDTPLHLASYRGYADIVSMLLKTRAKATLLNEKKKSAEQEAMGQGHVRVASILNTYLTECSSPVVGNISDPYKPGLSYNIPSSLSLGISDTRNNVGNSNMIAWNDLNLGVRDSDLSHASTFGTPLRTESLDCSFLRSIVDPQESEEPSSAFSWDGGSAANTADAKNYSLGEFPGYYINEKHTHSDTIADKRVKRPISVIGLPGCNGCKKLDLSGVNQTVQNTETKQTFNQRQKLTKSSFSKPQVYPASPIYKVSGNKMPKVMSGTVENQVLSKRLEEMSRFAENLQLKLVSSNEKISELEKLNSEKDTMLREQNLIHKKSTEVEETLKQFVEKSEDLEMTVALERSNRIEFQGRCEALSEEVNRLKLKLKTASASQTSPKREMIPSASNEILVSNDHESQVSDQVFKKHNQQSNNDTVPMKTALPQNPTNSICNIPSVELTHTRILHALNHCVGEKVLNDRQLHLLNQCYRSLLKTNWYKSCLKHKLLDECNTEWVPGRDFALRENMPLNQKKGGHREGSCSLIFRIRRQGQPYILKMMINLIDMASSGHGKGQSLPKFLEKNFGSEYEIPLHLPPHKNIIQIFHFYEGSTSFFRRFLPLLVPSSLDVPLDMANVTTFMVLPEYAMTLKDFITHLKSKNNQPLFGLCDKFLLLLLYQLLSAVDHLIKNGVVHRDIKSDNVFLDQRLRPIIGDFGFARHFHGDGGERVVFSDCDQVLAGNSNAWAPELARCHRDGPESLPPSASLEEVYEKADAYAVSRMFYNILCPPGGAADFPLSSIDAPHYDNTTIPPLPQCLSTGLSYILHQLVLDSPHDRPTPQQAMTLVGMLLFGPTLQEAKTASEFMAFYQSKLLQHLAVTIPAGSSDIKTVLSMEESMEENSLEVEVHLLTHATPQEMWDTCKIIRQNRLQIL